MEPETNHKTIIANSQLDKDCFLRTLQDCNNLDTLQYWIFHDGMHFSDSCQWWNRTKKRPCPHEGLDLVYYLNSAGKQHFFQPGTLIPAIFDGIVVHDHQDFLGQTLYIQHEQFQQNSKTLYSIYAHIAINNKLPQKIVRYSPIGVIAEVPDSSPVPSHLHLSMAWIENTLNINSINWNNIANHESVRLVDPLEFVSNAPETTQNLNASF